MSFFPGMDNTIEETSLFSNVRKAVNSCFSFPSSFICELCSIAVNGDAMQAKLGKNSRTSLHKPRQERNFVCLVGTFKPLIPSVVWFATSSPPGWMT